jgi:hypothetical protein
MARVVGRQYRKCQKEVTVDSACHFFGMVDLITTIVPIVELLTFVDKFQMLQLFFSYVKQGEYR